MYCFPLCMYATTNCSASRSGPYVRTRAGTRIKIGGASCTESQNSPSSHLGDEINQNFKWSVMCKTKRKNKLILETKAIGLRTVLANRRSEYSPLGYNPRTHRSQAYLESLMLHEHSKKKKDKALQHPHSFTKTTFHEKTLNGILASDTTPTSFTIIPCFFAVWVIHARL